MSSFKHDGHRLVYMSYGEGRRTVVLLPGLLFSQKMHLPLARALAERGQRVVTLDLLGHGRSDRPRDMAQYSMVQFAGQVVALLDHLELDQAVVGGTSLGANVSLEVAAAAPERLRGMVIEMPVLDNALLACAIAFTPLMIGLTFGAPLWRIVGAAARLVPQRLVPFWADVGLDWVRQDPEPSAAVLNGLFFGRTAPPKSERATLETKALVIGHQRDPIHPFSDAGNLVKELPDARLVVAESLVELRLTPERLTTEIASFVDECWAPKRASARKPRRRAS
ncbi:MAG TPA: alpha/beta fold hydrolase [Solirubrobacteraceae bacterium]|nr:alpha/beta fold hydrolase [Solirubrobacteraceae bacterium]